jgi:glycosyltransferase involved in cell wall biosynthesis
MRVAIVHDRLTVFGGAERLVLALQRIWPTADLFVGVADRELAERAGFVNLQTTYLQRLPGAAALGRASLPLHPHAFGRLQLHRYEAVISSSAFFAKCVRPPAGVPHVSFCHTPPRFLWDFSDSHLTDRSGRMERAAVAVVRPALRRADLRGASGVDQFLANSSFIADAVARHYGKPAIVIPPPVDVDRYEPAVTRGGYLLAIARLDPYKRIDRAIEASARLGIPLKVIGDGVDAARLRAISGPEVELLGWVEEAAKIELVRGALALVAPQVEDFGIAMVEALAAGVPVVAPAAGGALDIVESGRTGVLYDPDDPGALDNAIRKVQQLEVIPADLHASALRFSEPAFASAMREVVDATVARSPAR